MSNTKEEQQLIASLKHDSAFILLLEKIQALIDDLSDAMYVSANPALREELFHRWRALKTVLVELKMTPETIGLALDLEKKEEMSEFAENTTQKTREVLRRISEGSTYENPYEAPHTYEAPAPPRTSNFI